MELGSNFELNLKKKIKEQNNNINKYLNNEFSIYMDSGRSALRVVTSRIKHGKILLPAYICKSVVDCFQEQYEICFYQLNQSLGIEKESIEKYMIDCQYKCNILCLCCSEDLCRCFISKTLARSIIYYIYYNIKLILSYSRKIKSFRIKLS